MAGDSTGYIELFTLPSAHSSAYFIPLFCVHLNIQNGKLNTLTNAVAWLLNR